MRDGEAVEAYRLLMAEVYELAGLSRRISEREAAAQGTTVARWHVLSVVSEESATVPDIARRLGQVRQGVQRVVDDLTASGHLVRHPNPENPRSPRAGITATGQVLLDRLWAASAASRREVMATAELDERALLDARDRLRRLTTSLRAAERRPRTNATPGPDALKN